ncbi:DUF5082 family protein [Bacillus sp. MUM 13]|uniref:YwqH-like family protein n=1 Tax=Bacillus sp. MUM 13 TaxID=1678001 RepID=UPI0008F5872B|nr:DUF5082 family protein [Bacillus sp. MUM 13]OIK13886.1 hypothetical protein BIV59_04250 [Bacillus sp. MUM 13]
MLEYYNAQLIKKQKDITRLNSMKASLDIKMGEFKANENKSLEPELTSKAWFGKHADEFQRIRQLGIKDAYGEITGEQFTVIFTAISDKIAEINLEIESIKSTIATLEKAEEAKRATLGK